MKNSKKLKLVLMVLICILITLIGVVGIYTKSSNMYKNMLPDYTLASDIKGITVLEFEVDTSKDTVYYDKDGNEVDATTVTEENEKDYESKEIPVNAEENLNVENYNKTVQIMKKRLEFLNADQYQIDLDEQSGKIVLSVEDDYIEDIESILPMEGRLKLIDSKTEDVIIDYTDFKSAEATYASLDTEVITYINLKLNASGIEKINNIDKYKTAEVNEQDSEENTEEESEEVEENNLKVVFDSDEVAEITYDDILLAGKTLRITTASGLTSNSEIESQINMDTIVSKLATMGKTPVIYNLNAEEFVKNDIGNYITYIIIGIISVCVIISIIFIFKYKLNGLLAVLGFITNISLFLIIIRLTKIQISLNGFAGIVALIALYSILINNILKAIKEDSTKSFGEAIKTGCLATVDILIISLIILIVFSFASMEVINSMGLLLFWGWLITIIGNLIFTIPMLSIVNKK